jgi:hypothetical protein
VPRRASRRSSSPSRASASRDRPLGPRLAAGGLRRGRRGRRRLLVASPRWDSLELRVEPAARWREVPSDRIAEAVVAARGADGVLAVGGGSSIDLGKAISAGDRPAARLGARRPYAGAEWTTYFGVRDPAGGMRGGGGGAHLAAIVYEPELTLEPAARETVGTAMNALATAPRRSTSGPQPRGRRARARGRAADREWLPRSWRSSRRPRGRARGCSRRLHAGAALAGSMLALGHAMAQARRRRVRDPARRCNAVCLPPRAAVSTPRWRRTRSRASATAVGRRPGPSASRSWRSSAAYEAPARPRRARDDLPSSPRRAQRNGAKMQPAARLAGSDRAAARSVY